MRETLPRFLTLAASLLTVSIPSWAATKPGDETPLPVHAVTSDAALKPRHFYVTKAIGVRSGAAHRGVDQTLPVPVAKGVCYLTKVSGAFHGSGELAEIHPSSDGKNYVLTVTTGDAANDIEASAQCVSFSPFK